ncbi:CFEM domain-containing protein [Rutstroemia sp. NJR-2017a BBW]|nr:CFEM domain-containing protein [Rutstroemia sp. NJR-2017a BBW]
MHGIVSRSLVVPAAGCSLTDSACQCSSKDLAQASSLCLLQNCTMHDALGMRPDLLLRYVANNHEVVSKVQANTCNLPNANRSDMVLEATASIAAIAAIFVALRLFTRWWLNNTVGADDWIIGFDMVLSVFSTSQMRVSKALLVTKEGFGKHVWQLNDGDLLRVLRNCEYNYGFMEIASDTFPVYIAENIYVVILGLVKVSILVFYLGIFPQPWFQYVTWGAIAFVGISTTTLSFLTIFQYINALAYANSAMSIVQDILVVVVPIPILNKLQLGRKKKLAVLFMFAVGSFGCIISMIRLRSLLSFGNSIDPTWDYTMTEVWTVVELGVAIMCACFPAIRSLLVRVSPKLFASSAQYSQDSQSRSKPWYKPTSQQQRAAEQGEFIELRNADTQENRNAPQVPPKDMVKDQHMGVGPPAITVQHHLPRDQRIGPSPPIITAQHSWHHADNRRR